MANVMSLAKYRVCKCCNRSIGRDKAYFLGVGRQYIYWFCDRGCCRKWLERRSRMDQEENNGEGI